MTAQRMNGVTWAVLDVYAQTLEGQGVEGLREQLRRASPLSRLQGTARTTAAGLGALDERGHLTAQGLMAARAAVHRLNLGSAGGWREGAPACRCRVCRVGVVAAWRPARARLPIRAHA